MHRSREAIEGKASSPRISLRQTLSHHLNDEFVGKELTRIHKLGSLETERRPVSNRGAQHVSRGDMWDRIAMAETLTLRPLTCALLPEDDEPDPGRHRLT